MCHRKHNFKKKKKTTFIWIDKYIFYNFQFPKKNLKNWKDLNKQKLSKTFF
jgi:hypothetical protein